MIFQLDILIENNKFLVEALESIQRRLNMMSEDEARNYRLDESFGSRSRCLCKRGLKRYLHNEARYNKLIYLIFKRLYGGKVDEVFDGLIKCPLTAIPVILERLHHT